MPPTRAPAAISARTSSPTSSSTAKRWRIASPRPACAPPTRKAYWRDVGTVDAYWEANIDLTDVTPELDLYDRDWPIWTYAEITPPAKFVHDEDGRRGTAVSSLVSGDCIISGASLRAALLFTGVRINSYSSLEEAVVLPYCDIGRGARLRQGRHRSRRQIPEGLVVGEDPEFDAKRFRVTEGASA
jgi:glucose-1-phosphate adenylyltransferase